MMVALNAKGEIILCNKRGCDILGYEESEIIGRNWFSTCLPSNISDEVQGVFAQLMAGQVELVEFYENIVVTAGGEHRIIAFHNSALRGESSRITSVLFSGDDITERKRADEEVKASRDRL
ncbi:MAG: PAS domain S-box protein, partial [Longimicrobiales bacterium]|nr:PAS domain S-box protein [Longimicrobiales bacterium]